MQNLIKVVEEYLKLHTESALLITGKWGAGKTFYFDNNLSHEISNTVTIGDASIKYVPIRISLFGVTSVNEIQENILLELYPILKSKGVKIARGLAKVTARGIASVKGLGDPEKYIADVTPKAKDLINPHRVVICFDDIERKSDKIDIKEIIGYINVLSESGVKVIILANEFVFLDEETNNQNKSYKEFKEKVIGETIEFIPDPKETLLSLIDNVYSNSFRDYSKFLKDNLNKIIDFYKDADSNLRTIKYALNKLHFIYSSIGIEFPKKEDLIHSEFERFIQFTLAVSIEYKMNSIGFSDKDALNSGRHIELSRFDPAIFTGAKKAIDPEKPDNKQDIFIRKYYKDSEFIFFESIFNYVVGYDSFDVKKLKVEVDEKLNIEDNKVKRQYEVLKEIDYSNYLYLTDKEYVNKTREMINFALEGQYKLKEYPNIFQLALRFENKLNLNINKLLQKLKSAIRKGIENYKYDFFLKDDLRFFGWMSFEKESKDLIKFILEINEEVNKNKLEELKIKAWEKFVEEDEFSGEFIHPDSDFYSNPIFKDFSAHKVYSLALNSKLTKIRGIEEIFMNRYNHTGYKHNSELSFLKNLQVKLQPNPGYRKKKTLRNNELNRLLDATEKGIAFLEGRE